MIKAALKSTSGEVSQPMEVVCAVEQALKLFPPHDYHAMVTLVDYIKSMDLHKSLDIEEKKWLDKIEKIVKEAVQHSIQNGTNPYNKYPSFVPSFASWLIERNKTTDAFKFVKEAEDFCVSQMTGSYAVGTIGLPSPESEITSEAWQNALERIRSDFQQNHRDWYANLPTGFKRKASAAKVGGIKRARK